MLAVSPITRQTVGRTFIVAISLLGAVAACQIGVVVWAFVAHSHSAAISAPERFNDLRGSDQIIATVQPNPAVVPEEPDFSTAPLAAATTTPAATTPAPAPPKPTPLPARTPTLPEPEPGARFKETIGQGKTLRDRGDMSTALTRFREASAMDSKSPEALFEIAVTLEKMQLGEKASEQWRRIYDIGESAGPYYTTAEARLNQVKQEAMLKTLPPSPSAENVEGIAPGKTLGLLNVTAQDQEDRTASRHLTLKIPIKARGPEKIEVRDLVIQVLFYEIVDSTSLVQTTANVSSRWITAPADWLDSDTETLEVDYQLPLPDTRAARRENRKYFGYLIRIYYKGDLQASGGEPEKLVQQFPPEKKLPTDGTKN